MSQPWPEPDDRRLPIRMRVVIWDRNLCRADGALSRWLGEMAGADGYELTPAGVPGRNTYYVMLPSFVVARLLLDDWAGHVAIDVFRGAEEERSTADGKRAVDRSR